MQSDIEPGLDGLRFFRHLPETPATFAARITIPGVVDGMTFATRNGQHETVIEIQARREGRHGAGAPGARRGRQDRP